MTNILKRSAIRPASAMRELPRATLTLHGKIRMITATDAGIAHMTRGRYDIDHTSVRLEVTA
jgi:hypothetical protein